MFKLIILLIALAVFPVQSYCSETTETIIHDFGQVSPSGILSHTFILEKKVESAISLCECVSPTVKKNKQDKTEVNIEFDLADYEGFIEQEVIVTAEDGSIIVLRVRATIE